MPIVRTRIASLPQVQRDEVRAILAEGRKSSRFESNADEASFPFYVLLAGSVAGVIGYLVVFGNPVTEIPEFWSNVIRYPGSILRNPATLGVQIALPVGIYSAWRIAANFRGNGWALTSFGFAHIIRGKIRYLPYAEIADLTVNRGIVGRTRRSYSTVIVTARDGAEMKTYAGSLVAGLKTHLPADATRPS